MRRFNKAATLLSLCASVALAGCMSSNEDTDETMAEADQALVQPKGNVGMGQAGGWASAPVQGEAPALPPTAELPTEGKGLPVQPIAGGCAQIPTCVAPNHEAPSFQAPTYPAPTFGAPTYSPPVYHAPNYGSPTYQAPGVVPNVGAPTYTAPTYSAPQFQAPIYEAPTYLAPSFPAPIYMTPNYEAPHPMMPANPTAGCYGGFAGQNQLAPIGQAPIAPTGKAPTCP